jgi:hypothetical protein
MGAALLSMLDQNDRRSVAVANRKRPWSDLIHHRLKVVETGPDYRTMVIVGAPRSFIWLFCIFLNPWP